MGSGTVGGLLAFFDYLVDKKLATAATVSPLKSAVRQVFEMVQGNEDINDIDVRNLDVEDYLGRFEIGARGTGKYKPDSVQAYRSRFTRAIGYYTDYLTTGETPKFRHGKSAVSGDSRPRPRAKGKIAASTPTPPAATAETAVVQQPTDFISYPFPLENGEIATFRLPRRLQKADAERAAVFLRTLVFEPQRLIEAPPEEDDPEPIVG